MHGLDVLKKLYIDLLGENQEALDALEREQYLSITVNEIETLLVFDESEPEKLAIKASVGEIPLDTPVTVTIMKILLEANFEFCGTRGATLGVNSQTGEVCMFYNAHCVEASIFALQQLVFDFSKAAKIWQEALITLIQEAR